MTYDQPSAYALLPRNLIVAGHFNERDTYSCTRPNGMSSGLITYTLSGEGCFRTPHSTRICRAGDITILKPGTPHEYGTVQDRHWEFHWMHFPERHIEASLLPSEPLFVDPIDAEPIRIRIHDAFNRILFYARASLNWKQELCMNALQEILYLLAQRRMRNYDPRTEEVLHLLSDRMLERVSIADIARSIGLSASRLSHIFKQDTGESIMDRLNRIRIQQAALLLKHSGRRPSEVCHDVGYHNYNHFLNQFRKYYQTTPSEYLKRTRSD